MLNKLQNVRKNVNKKGFTLVELIVVIIIIAVLAAVAIPAVQGFQDSSRKSRIKSEHRQLISAIQSYYGDNSDDTKAALEALDDVATLSPYLAKQGSKTTADVLAKNPDGTAAHTVTDGVLTSTWKAAASSKTETWTYDISKSVGQ